METIAFALWIVVTLLTEAGRLIWLALPGAGLAVSIAATGLHTIEELTDDGAPIWDYLGLPVSWGVGLVGLLAFGGVQIGLAWAGYLSGERWALWALLAVRLGDSFASHWLPWLTGRRPNPGIRTTRLYLLEALALAALLCRGS
jgi:hypothetical protein